MVTLSHKINTVFDGVLDFWVEGNIVYITRCVWPDWYVFYDNPLENDMEDVDYWRSEVDSTITLKELDEAYEKRLDDFATQYHEIVHDEI